jgi:hypothetical protein
MPAGSVFPVPGVLHVAVMKAVLSFFPQKMRGFWLRNVKWSILVLWKLIAGGFPLKPEWSGFH